MLGGGFAFKKVAIPLLITAGDEKALPHLWGAGEAAIVGRVFAVGVLHGR